MREGNPGGARRNASGLPGGSLRSLLQRAGKKSENAPGLSGGIEVCARSGCNERNDPLDKPGAFGAY